MVKLKPRSEWLPIVLAVLTLAVSSAEARTDIFFTAIGPNNEFLDGGGSGYGDGEWHFYPNTAWWSEWFYSGPYTPRLKQQLDVSLTIEPLQADQPCLVQIAYKWTTSGWSQMGMNRPPLLADVITAADEAKFTQRRMFFSSRFPAGSKPITFKRHLEIPYYNPEWVSIEVRGRNFLILDGSVDHGGVPRDAEGIALTNQLQASEPTGACCRDGVNKACEEGHTEVSCSGWDDIFLGYGSTCAGVNCDNPPTPLEACCLPDGSCQALTPQECLNSGGTPQGPATACETTDCPQPPPKTQACCFDDGSCADLTEQQCLNSGGTPQGPGTTCQTTDCPQPPEKQACCFDDGSCADLTEDQCRWSGGTPQGLWTTCQTTDCPQPATPPPPAEKQACCFDDGSCADLTEEQCLNSGGTPQGEGTNCKTVDCRVHTPAVGCLVAHWRLDETTGTIAHDSVGNNHGVLFGNPLWRPDAGMVGGALDFDGDGDYVEIPKIGESVEFTYAMWVAQNKIGSSLRALINHKDWKYGSVHLQLRDGHPQLGINEAITPTGDLDAWDYTLAVNEWQHVAVVKSATLLVMYVDGQEAARRELTMSDTAILGNGFIGAWVNPAWGETRYFNGLLDDVRIYNCALSKDEIQQFIGAEPEPEPEPEGPNIIWVSYHGADNAPSGGAADAGFTEAPDKGYTDLLTANGYNVTRYITTGTPDVSMLNAADLVIIGRSAASSHYGNDVATTWNATVTAPMIITCGYKLRSSRMGYTTGTDMPDTTGDIRLNVSNTTHPIFAGIPLTNGTMDNPYAGVVTHADGTLARGISINNNPLDDEGIILATIAEASAAEGPVGGVVIAEWHAGATLTHAGGAETDVLAGPRLVLLTGSREPSGISSETAGIFDLYPDGAQMFLNAVAYMLPGGPVLQLDIGNSNNPEELEEGFTPFTFADSGSVVNGITIEFGGYNAGDSRRRGAPTGVPYENIYRDFIFARQAETGVGYVTVTLSGLEANRTYGITLYSWDTNSTGLRVTDWTANGEFLFTAMNDGSVNPPVEADDYAFTGAATADANGVIFMEAVPGEGTFAAEPFGFINALVISSEFWVKP